MSNNEKINVTGLDNSSDFKNDEYDILSALLSAADFKNDENEKREIRIERNGVFHFSFSVRPLDETEVQAARKKATTYIKNPAGNKYPPIPKETSATKYNSYLIYTATVEADKKRIWGNKEFMKQKNILDAADSVDELLKTGEKSQIIDIITEISGFNGKIDTLSEEEFIKN